MSVQGHDEWKAVHQMTMQTKHNTFWQELNHDSTPSVLSAKRLLHTVLIATWPEAQQILQQWWPLPAPSSLQ